MVHLHHHEQDEYDPIADAARLRNELATVYRSPAYQLGVTLNSVIAGIVEDEGVLLEHVHDAVDTAIDDATEKEIHNRAAPLIKEKTAQAIAAQTVEIDRQAEAEAEQAAALAVEQFDAAAYREKVRGRLGRVAAANALLEEKRRIEAEEAAAADDAPESVAIPESETRAQLKARAAAIRRETRPSQILPYSLLREDDVITLCFAAEGHGNDPYTTNEWGTSTYNSSTERRRLSVRLRDPALGAFEVVDDSLWHGQSLDQDAIRPGRRILVLSDNPDTEDGLEPLLVKANGVTLEALSGNPVGSPKLDLWWVGLGDDDFRILS